MDAQALFGMERRVLAPLEGAACPSTPLERLIRDSCIRLLDSGTIIKPSVRAARHGSATAQPLPQAVTLAVARIDELLQGVPRNLPLFLPDLLNRFGATLLALCGDEHQQTDAARWSAAGVTTAFMMTDAGGSSVSQWRSSAVREGDGFRLTIDKRWILGAVEARAAMVAVRGTARQYPVLFQVAPEEFAGLRAEPCGPAFLGERMQLGNVAGEVQVGPGRLLKRNQILGARTFLGLIRPRFVAAVMGHVLSLARDGGLVMTDETLALVDEVHRIALSIRPGAAFGAADLDRSLAVKIVANETLLRVAGEVCARTPAVARDLLGFSKMEGSSYRCLLELVG